MTSPLSGRVHRLLAVLAAVALAVTLLPVTGSQAQQPDEDDEDDLETLPLEQDEDDEGDDPEVLPEQDEGDDPVDADQTGQPVEDGEGPPVTEFEGETGTIVERSGDGLAPSFRYRGVGRHDTAGLVALDGKTFRAEQPNAFREADDVIVARADDFPDSMAGATLAGAVTAPVLLVDTAGDIQADTQDALDTIEPSRIFALGGTEAISEQVESDLEALDYVDTVERVAGDTRFETAAEVARTANEEEPVPELVDDTVALLATGEEFADALTGGQVAYDGPFPLLLTSSDALVQPAEDALADLEVDRVLVLGGDAAVSDDVVSTLEGLDYDVDRLAGRDRTVTAVEIAEFALDELDFTDEHVSVARGNNFADALAIAPHAGEEGHPLLISATQDEFGQQEVVDFYTERGCTFEDVHVSGGFAAVETPLEQQIRQVATGQACDLEVVTEEQTVDSGEAVEVEADVLTSLGESSTAGIGVTFETEAQVGGDDAVACEPEQAETDGNGRAACTLQTEEAGLYEITATVTTSEGEEVSDSVLIGVGVAVEPPDEGETESLEFPLASEREVGEGFADSPNPLGPAGGEAESVGDATLTVDREAGEACLEFFASGVEGDFATFEDQQGTVPVHVHRAEDPDAPADLEPFAINGPVEIAFSEQPAQDPVTGSFAQFENCEAADDALLQEIIGSPGEFYVNAHTDAWPGGNLRGQVDGEWDGEDRSDDEPADTE